MLWTAQADAPAAAAQLLCAQRAAARPGWAAAQHACLYRQGSPAGMLQAWKQCDEVKGKGHPHYDQAKPMQWLA